MTDTPNYPDILGYITGGERVNVNVVQVALAVRPRNVRAGRPFEAILMVQNASDINVDVGVNLEVPERDSKKQKGMFISKKNRLVVGLRPAEVGYIVLPIACMAGTGVDNNYKLSMEVKAKPLDKPNRIRLPGGGGKIPIDSLREETRTQMEELKKLNFVTSKRFGLGDKLEATFNVLPGRLGQIPDFQPGWVNLWAMSDHVDEEALMQRYGNRLLERALPQLKREHVFAPLAETTQARFSAAGYPLQAAEALTIAKLLTHVLEMAAPKEDNYDYLGNPSFNVALTLKKRAEGIENDIPELPRWFVGLLHQVARNEELLRAPAQVVSKLLYNDLLMDVLPHAFTMIKTATGEDMGTGEEIYQYGQQLLARLEGEQPMDFTHAYLPLVMGGVIVYDRVVTKDENIVETLHDIAEALAVRDAEASDEEASIVDLTKQLINRHAAQFGYQV